MDGWRQKGEIHREGTRSQNRKPPNGCWQPTVPAWEKKFCTSVGSVPWRKLLEAKKFMYLYDNVVQWNDSAGEEAFHNAKNRFWAEINGLPCDISLPDPDIYIDEIDWDSSIDPELLLDLEREPDTPEEGDKEEKVVIVDTSLLLNQSFSGFGWGDDEEIKATDVQPGPGFGDWDRNVGDDKNSWEDNCYPSNATMKDRVAENSQIKWDDNENGWENYYNETKNMDTGRNDGVWGTWDENNRKKEGSGWHMSRYKTSRYRGDYYQMKHGWRNGRGRKDATFCI